jgi:Ca2+/Na+ antiporter
MDPFRWKTQSTVSRAALIATLASVPVFVVILPLATGQIGWIAVTILAFVVYVVSYGVHAARRGDYRRP